MNKELKFYSNNSLILFQYTVVLAPYATIIFAKAYFAALSANLGIFLNQNHLYFSKKCIFMCFAQCVPDPLSHNLLFMQWRRPYNCWLPTERQITCGRPYPHNTIWLRCTRVLMIGGWQLGTGFYNYNGVVTKYFNLPQSISTL